MLSLALILTGCCVRTIVRPAPFEGRVVRVIDGDTIVITVDGGDGCCWEEKVRIWGVDTPERGEPGWTEATEALRNRLRSGQSLRLTYPERNSKGETVWRDAFGRLLAEISEPNQW